MHPSQLFYPVPEIVAPSVQTQLTGEVEKPLSRQILVFPDDDSGKEGSPVEVLPPADFVQKLRNANAIEF